MTRSNTKITDTTKKTGSRASQTRIPRSEEKRQVVKIPNGKGGFIKMVKSPIDTLGSDSIKLGLPAKTGMYRQWISNESDGRLQRYVNLGFTPVTENGIHVDPRHGGVRKNSTSYLMYPMEIEESLLEKLREKDKLENPALQAQERQNKLLIGQTNTDIHDDHGKPISLYKVADSNKTVLEPSNKPKVLS